MAGLSVCDSRLTEMVVKSKEKGHFHQASLTWILKYIASVCAGACGNGWPNHPVHVVGGCCQCQYFTKEVALLAVSW